MAVQHKKTLKQDSHPKSSSNVDAKWLLKNVLFLILALVLVKYIFSEHPTYRWVYHDLLKGNMKVMKEHPKLSFDQKMQMKLGADYDYLLFLKRTTPENAVILYPSQEAFSKKGSPFTQIYNKMYATRFLYPRKLVLESELDVSKYANEITHVAIVNGEGRDKLSYPVDTAYQHGVLPVKPQK